MRFTPQLDQRLRPAACHEPSGDAMGAAAAAARGAAAPGVGRPPPPGISILRGATSARTPSH
eukprot:1174962-Pyramimonas_sp.AAC.1